MIEEGRKFKELIEDRGLTLFKFSCATMYSNSRIYEFVNGKKNLRTLAVHHARKFASVLGFNTIDEFFNAVGIDLTEELKVK